MLRILITTVLLFMSFHSFADETNQYSDTPSGYPEHYGASTSDSYRDETSSSMSSTSTPDSQSGMMNPEQTVLGTMGGGESATDRYNKLHVGLLGGVTEPNSSTTTASTEYGMEIGYQPTSLWNVGAEATTTKLDRTDEARRTMALLKATTQFGESTPVLKEFFFGAAGGTVVTDGKWQIGGGPLAGFDVPIGHNRSHDFLSVGANAKYIFTKDTPDSLIAALAVKYWF